MSQQENQPPVPNSSQDVTPEWVSQILGVEISTQNFEIETDIQSGSGFLSSMIRLRCRSASKEFKEFNLIVKLLPEKMGTMRDLVISESFDKTEINFYQKTMHDLIEVLPELEMYLCKSPYGQIQLESKDHKYASVLVMEDLKPQGYYTINFAGEESAEQIEEVMTFMAKFHYAGLALEKNKGKPLPNVYDFLQGVSGSAETSMFYEMAKGGFEEIQQLLKDHGAQDRVIEAYRKLAPYSDQIIKKVEAAGKEKSCLMHGDCWSNNMLFNDNPCYHTKVIDWQLLGYKDTSYDLAVTIVSSIPMDQLNKGMVHKYLQHYYTTFVKQCEKAGHSCLISRDFEEFSQFFYSWGMSYTMIWFLMASEPFSLNFKRLVKIYEFLVVEVNVPEFLMSQME